MLASGLLYAKCASDDQLAGMSGRGIEVDRDFWWKLTRFADIKEMPLC